MVVRVQGRAMKSLWKAPGERHKDGVGAKAVDDDSAYDEMRIEAVGGARARAADREPTQEEREAAAAAAGDGGGDDTAAPAGGYAARRARAELEVRTLLPCSSAFFILAMWPGCATKACRICMRTGGPERVALPLPITPPFCMLPV